MNIKNFILNSNDTIKSALIMIDKNQKGFLIIVDDTNTVVGTLTDGDIRRALIKGYNINDKVTHAYKTNFKYINIKDNFSKVIELFKSKVIEFLPIVDDEKKLINIITKKNMHVLLMENIEFDLKYDFLSLDDTLLEHEIYNRPWGYYKTTFLNAISQSKIIAVNPNSVLSLQEHKRREEHWIIIHGEGEVILGESLIKATPGKYFYIPKGCKHRIINTSDTTPLMIAEVQLGEYFGEDDIIRYQDFYGRV